MGILPLASLLDDWCTKIFNKQFGRIKVPVHLEKINRPLGATQAKLKYYKVPVYIDIINRPLGATRVNIRNLTQERNSYAELNNIYLISLFH